MLKTKDPYFQLHCIIECIDAALSYRVPVVVFRRPRRFGGVRDVELMNERRVALARDLDAGDDDVTVEQQLNVALCRRV